MTQVRCIQSIIIDLIFGLISALGSAYINDYEKYTTEAVYLLNFLSEINFD